MGVSTNYLTDFRFQKSKMYLRTSHLSIKEFAEKSPSQFRKYMINKHLMKK